MAIRNLKKEIQWAVSLTVSLIIVIASTACAINKSPDNGASIKRWKSKQGNTYINLISFHSKDSLVEFPATYHVNNLIFPPEAPEGLVLAVMPGTFTITAGGISKSWKNLKPLKVERGDSLVVKIFLEDDTEPLLD